MSGGDVPSRSNSPNSSRLGKCQVRSQRPKKSAPQKAWGGAGVSPWGAGVPLSGAELGREAVWAIWKTPFLAGRGSNPESRSTPQGAPPATRTPKPGAPRSCAPSSPADPTHLQVHPDHPLSHALPCCHGCAPRADPARPELPASRTHTPQQPGAEGAA